MERRSKERERQTWSKRETRSWSQLQNKEIRRTERKAWEERLMRRLIWGGTLEPLERSVVKPTSIWERTPRGDLSAATKTMKIPHQGCTRSLSHPLKILQNAAQEVTLTINKPRSRALTRNQTSCLAKPTLKTWRVAVWATRKLMSLSLSKTTLKLSEWRF